MPSPEEHKSALMAQYFENGSKRCTSRLGFELERFLVDSHGKSVPYSGSGGVKQLLEELQGHYESEIYDEEHLIGLARRHTTLTLEPGAQIEISTGPFCEIREIQREVTRFDAEISEQTATRGQHLLALGYRAHERAEAVEIIPKKRYTLMNAYFAQTGTCGMRMMRGSASTQISIDYKDEQDALAKMRLATVLGPLFALVTDNSPVYERRRATFPLARTYIWNHVDTARCMTIPHLFDADFSFEQYARYLLHAPLIVGINTKGKTFDACGKSAAELYEGQELSTALIEHILSMFFFDVRLKNYVEIRMADSLPLDYALAYAALIKGVFYSEEAFEQLSDELIAHPLNEKNVVAAKQALMQTGYEAKVYDKPAKLWLDELMELAYHGLSKDEQPYLRPLAELVAARTTLCTQALHEASER